jgi:hypothetical protein
VLWIGGQGIKGRTLRNANWQEGKMDAPKMGDTGEVTECVNASKDAGRAGYVE